MGFIYIAQNDDEGKKLNRFKIGCTEDLIPRLKKFRKSTEAGRFRYLAVWKFSDDFPKITIENLVFWELHAYRIKSSKSEKPKKSESDWSEVFEGPLDQLITGARNRFIKEIIQVHEYVNTELEELNHPRTRKGQVDTPNSQTKRGTATIFKDILESEPKNYPEDLQMLALSVLRANSILADNYISPPFGIWPLPRSNQNKGSKATSSSDLPRLCFLGAPLQGIKAAKLTPDLSQLSTKADDEGWILRTLREIHHRAGGGGYGGQWSMARWLPGQGVDTSDFQRVAEYAMDCIAVMDPYDIKDFLAGEKKPMVEIPSIRKAHRLITGLYQGIHKKSPLEILEKSLNPICHPEFTVILTDPLGKAEEETPNRFKIFEGMEPIQGPRGALGFILTLTPVAVALGVGMAIRLSKVVSHGNRHFDTKGIAELLEWINNHEESERRLARHLCLSPQSENGFSYLNEPYYAACVIGHKLNSHRMSSHRIYQNLHKSKKILINNLDSLKDLPSAQSYIRLALEGIGKQ